MIYKLFSSWEPKKNVSSRTRISDIAKYSVYQDTTTLQIFFINIGHPKQE